MKNYQLFKGEFERELQKAFFGKNILTQAISAALLSEGKRIRPILVYLVADALGFSIPIMPAALACEYFHTASLIADDLPCMDNDDFRREKPSLHRLYGERIALLSSYALISEAFWQIEQNGRLMQKTAFRGSAFEATAVALHYASICSGIRGAVLGQYYDLERRSKTAKDLEEVITLKTISLFEGAFVLGWLFGGGEIAKVEEVKKLATHFGMAFQIRDDLLDMEQDKIREGAPNFALFLGRERAEEKLYAEGEAFLQLLEDLELSTPSFQEVGEMIFTLPLLL